MNGQASINGYLSARSQFRPRLRRIETPAETPAVGTALETQAAEDFSQEMFIRLAEEDPPRLLSLLQSKSITRPAFLNFAAAAAGRISNSAVVVFTLLPLLQHADPVVREGAIYGLEPHLEQSLEARETLRSMVTLEPSPGVRSAIEEALSILG